MLISPDGHQDNGVINHIDEVGKAAIVVMLTPVLVVHFFIMMLPMRIAYAATVREGTDKGLEVAIKTERNQSDQGSSEGVDRSKAMPLTSDTQGEKELSRISVNAIPVLMRENLARPELGLHR